MTVYVDDWRQRARLGPVEGSWSHLLGDDAEELHRFAARLGLRRAWYQEHRRHRALNHYDVTEEARCRAIALGAVPVSWRGAGRMVRRWRRAAPVGRSGPGAEGGTDGPTPGGPAGASETVPPTPDIPGAGSPGVLQYGGRTDGGER